MTSHLASVPDTLEQALSPEWLTAALQQRFPGAIVNSVVCGPVVDRISTNARFTVSYDGGASGQPPTRLCVKGYFNETGRAAQFIGEPEACFYRDLADAIGVRTLRPLYAGVDPETRHGVIVTEDVVALGGVFLDGNSRFEPGQVAESLTELARLHAATWRDARFTD